MIFFGREKLLQGYYFCDYRICVKFRSYLLNRFLDDFFFFFRFVEDDTSVLGTYIMALSFESGGIVKRPEKIPQFLIIFLLCIIIDTVDFFMSRFTSSYFLIYQYGMILHCEKTL